MTDSTLHDIRSKENLEKIFTKVNQITLGLLIIGFIETFEYTRLSSFYAKSFLMKKKFSLSSYPFF